VNVVKVVAATVLAGGMSIGVALFGQRWLEQYAHLAPGLTARAPAAMVLPDLRFVDPEGREVRSSSWAGRTVILSYWATWCVPCVRQLELLEERQARYGSGRLQVVGIAIDRPEEVRAWLAERTFSFPIVLGGAVEAIQSQRFGNRVQGLPFLALFDPLGRQTFGWTGTLDAADLDAALARIDEAGFKR